MEVHTCVRIIVQQVRIPLPIAMNPDIMRVYAKFKVLRQVAGKLNEILQNCVSPLSDYDLHYYYSKTEHLSLLKIVQAKLPITAVSQSRQTARGLLCQYKCSARKIPCQWSRQCHY